MAMTGVRPLDAGNDSRGQTPVAQSKAQMYEPVAATPAAASARHAVTSSSNAAKVASAPAPSAAPSASAPSAPSASASASVLPDGGGGCGGGVGLASQRSKSRVEVSNTDDSFGTFATGAQLAVMAPAAIKFAKNSSGSGRRESKLSDSSASSGDGATTQSSQHQTPDLMRKRSSKVDFAGALTLDSNIRYEDGDDLEAGGRTSRSQSQSQNSEQDAATAALATGSEGIGRLRLNTSGAANWTTAPTVSANAS